MPRTPPATLVDRLADIGDALLETAYWPAADRSLPVFAEWPENWTFGAILATAFGYLLTLLLIRWVLLTKKRYPASTIAWMMAIISLPILGGILFLLFGVNRVERRAKSKRSAHRTLRGQLPGLAQYHVISGEMDHPLQKHLMRMTQRVVGTTPTTGNRIELLPDTHRTLGLIEQAIAAAKHSLHLEYYIWQPDKTGKRVRDLLIERARDGIEVRFLYDGLGSRRLNRKFLNAMRDVGIHVASFLPGPTLRERWSLNLRSHRKIVIVDGAVGFTGGMNIGDEYLGRNPAFGFWRDTHLRMAGPAVLQLQQVFAEDWFYATGEELTDRQFYPTPADTGRTVAQVVAGGPTGDVEEFHTLMFAAINEARQRIHLATSYFVPPPALAIALETAALRGVKVRLLVPRKSAHFYTVMAGRSYYESLLNSGCEIHEFADGLLHSKTLTVDGVWSLVGTPNFDARSLLLNFEVGVAMYDTKIAAQLEQHFEDDLQRARRILPEEWARRSAWSRLGESCCRLFSPVL